MLFYGTYVGKIVGKATSEGGCCMANVGLRCYTIFRETFLYQLDPEVRRLMRRLERLHLKIFYHHHHHAVPSARISLTLSRHPSLSFISSGRSSRLHPVSAQSCFIYDLASRPAFVRQCERVNRSSSLMSSSLLLQLCSPCLVRLT